MSNPAVTGVSGQRVAGRYILDQRLGRGGYGSVWRATDERSRERTAVALKMIRARRRGDAVAAQRFEREAVSLQRLVHPNTVRLLDYGRSDEAEHYIVLELLDGETLGQRLEGGLMEAPEVQSLALGVLQSLAEAHTLRIIHRDLKPANLFLSKGGGVKVLDWGLVKSLNPDDEPAEPALTEQGTVVGSIQYLAPEVIHGRTATAASDIYSLGCSLFAALVGGAPFAAAGGNAAAIARAHADVPAPRPHRDGQALYGSMVDAIQRMMVKEPNARPGTIEALQLFASLKAPLAEPRGGEAEGDGTMTLPGPDDSTSTHILR